MYSPTRRKKLALFLSIPLIISLACLNGGGAESDDFEATQQAIESTQAALEAQQQEEQQQPPTQPPPATAPPQQDEPPPPPEDAPPPDFSQLQSGDILYATEFSGPGDWEEGWFHFTVPDDRENYQAFVENDYLYVEVTDGQTTAYVLYDPIYMPRDEADVQLETFIDNVGEARSNNISLVCRANEDGWYEFSLTSSGLYYIYKYTGGNDFEILSQGGLQDYDKNVTKHELIATCIGEELTFYIDGEVPRFGQVTDRSFREGGFGLGVYAVRSNLVAVEFDYFVASIP